MTTSRPSFARSLASFSAAGCTSSSPTVSGMTHTCAGATVSGHMMPFSSLCCSTMAAMVREMPTP